MSDERDPPEENNTPPEPPSSIELSEDLRKGYVEMTVQAEPSTDIVDDMSDMPAASQVSMEPEASEQPAQTAPPPSDKTE